MLFDKMLLWNLQRVSWPFETFVITHLSSNRFVTTFGESPMCLCCICRFWLCAGRWTLVWSTWTSRVCWRVLVWPDSCRSSLLCCWRGGWSSLQTNSGTDRQHAETQIYHSEHQLELNSNLTLFVSGQCLIPMCSLCLGTTVPLHVAAHVRTSAPCQHAGHMLLSYSFCNGGAVSLPAWGDGYAHWGGQLSYLKG